MTTEPYSPSNGTEGAVFMECFCFRCAKDNFNEDTGEGGCPILAASFSKAGVPEWVRDADSDVTLIGGNGARCTAFVPRSSQPEEPTYRCPLTKDMFE